MSQLVLSLFPGIGLLDMAFEEEGFCVVRGPDLLWGGDIRRFHPPAGKFDGVIGGPPCQAFSRLVHIVRANGHKVADNLIPEFERCVSGAQPDWFVMENVPDAPEPTVTGYTVTSQLVEDRMVGGATERTRRFSFGFRGERGICDCGHADFQHDGWDCLECSCADAAYGSRFGVETLALAPCDVARAVVCDAREVPVKMLKNGRPKGGGRLPHVGKPIAWERRCELQGLPADFLKDTPLTAAGKNLVLGNGVPLPMGRAVAKAVKRALGVADPETLHE